jgi:hypothetical protein
MLNVRTLINILEQFEDNDLIEITDYDSPQMEASVATTLEVVSLEEGYEPQVTPIHVFHWKELYHK